MKFFIKVFLILLGFLMLTSCKPTSQKEEMVIGIVEPIEHRALTEIAVGFSEELTRLYKHPVTIKVENAQNDTNLQRAIIQKMQDAHYAMIVPMGVATTNMTLAMVRDIPIVSLASDLKDATRKKMRPCHAVAVHDEIPSAVMITFIHTVYPKLTDLTLVHSTTDKVFPQVKEAIAAGKKYGITVHHLMVASLSELYQMAQALPKQTQGIFILKDNLIASGIGTLAKIANVHHLPLITSDQGSVQDGAGFALGVHEREIGIEGGKLAAEFFNGKPICQLPIVTMKNLTVFLNKKALKAASQETAPILKAAKTLHYQTESVS